MRSRSLVLCAFGWNIRPFHAIIILQYSDLRNIKKYRSGWGGIPTGGEGDGS